MTFRRTLLGFALLSMAAGPVHAQSYPSGETVTLIVGWSAGGGTDILTRFIADRLSRATDAKFIVENRTGAGATIASELVANATPDGTTMMMATADSHTIAPLLNSNLVYDAMADFEPVYLVATLSFSMVARPDLEVETAQDVIALARKGDGLTVATWGVGSTAHIAAELFNQATGVSLVHVPYQGTAPAINDLQNSHIDLMFLGPSTINNNVEAGTMRFVAAASANRIGLAPGFPTFGEQGIDGVEMLTWFGIIGPDGLPDEVVIWWDAQMSALMEDPEFLDHLKARGMDPAGRSKDGFVSFLREQSNTIGTVIEKAGITIE